MFFGKKEKNIKPEEVKRQGRSKFVLDLVSLKKQKEAELNKTKHFFQTTPKIEEEKKLEPVTYKSKIFDNSHHYNTTNKGKEMKEVLRQTPGLLDRMLSEPKAVKNNLARGGVFVVILLLIMFSFKIMDWTRLAKDTKKQILGEAVSAFDDLVNGVDSFKLGNFANGGNFFEDALNKFTSINNKLQDINQLFVSISGVLPGKTAEAVESGGHLINGGQALSKALTNISEKAPMWFAQKSTDTQSDFNFVKILNLVKQDMLNITPNLVKADDEFSRVNINVIPEEQKQSFDSARSALSKFVAEMTKFQSMTDSLGDLLGANGERRYLVLFQNNRELRPTGGFIGSFSLIDVKNGKIENIETPQGGPYDIAPNLTEFIKPPAPLQFVNYRWEMHDANWFPDFPITAKKIQWFYDKSGGPTVDGVISVTPNVLQRLLKITGPINMEEYETIINDSNVIDILEQQAEDSSDKQANVPKKIISQIFPEILQKVMSFDIKNGADALSALTLSVDQKDIMLYSNNQKIQTVFEDHNWSGQIDTTDSDYLMVVGANIAGGKTDHVIDEWLDLKTVVQNDGRIINKLTITRKHNGSVNNQFENQTNQEFIRVYVPEGATLLQATGFKGPTPDKLILSNIDLTEDDDLVNFEGSPIIDERSGTRTTQEFGKTVFGNWMTVAIGETAQAVFEYELPFKLQKPNQSIIDKLFNNHAEFYSYSLDIQKQAGKTDFLTSSIDLASDMSISWNSSSSKLIGQNKASYSKIVDKDSAYGIVFKK